MASARSCLDCRRLSDQFLLARATLTNVILSRDTIPSPYGGRVDEMISFLTELRTQTGRAFGLHRSEHHPVTQELFFHA